VYIPFSIAYVLPVSHTLSYSSTETRKHVLPEKGITVKTSPIISHASAAGVVMQSGDVMCTMILTLLSD